MIRNNKRDKKSKKLSKQVYLLNELHKKKRKQDTIG